MKFIRLCILLLLLVIAFSCKKKHTSEVSKTPAEKTLSISLVDYRGRNIELSSAAKRVVVMADNAVSFIKQLNAIDRVVGLDSKTLKFLPQSILSKTNPEILNLPNVGYTNNPNYELLLSLKADLIIFKGSANEASVLSEKTKIPVVCIVSKAGYDFDVYRFLGKMLGKSDRAEEIIRLLEKYKGELENITKGVKEQKKAFFIVQNSKKGLTRSLKNIVSCETSNIVNIADQFRNADNWGFVEINKESFTENNPDLIFIDLPYNENSIVKEDVISSEIFKFTDAIKNHRVYYVNSFSTPKDYVYVVAEAYYCAFLAYPELVSEQSLRDCVNLLFGNLYGLKNYYEEFKKTLQY